MRFLKYCSFLVVFLSFVSFNFINTASAEIGLTPDQKQSIRQCARNKLKSNLVNSLNKNGISKNEVRLKKQRVKVRCRNLFHSIMLEVYPKTVKIGEEVNINIKLAKTASAIKIEAGDGSVKELLKSNKASYVTSYPTAGQYLVKALVSFRAGFSFELSKDVTVLEKEKKPETPEKKPLRVPLEIKANIPTDGEVNQELSFAVTTNATKKDKISFNWQFGDGNFSNEQNPVHQYTETGDFKVVITATTDTGDSRTAVFTTRSTSGSDSQEGIIKIKDPVIPPSQDCVIPDQQEPEPYTEAARWYEDFANKNLGALKEPLIYQYAGWDLKFNEESISRHISENSAALGWQNNLPTKGFVRYGIDSENLDQSTPITRRYHAQHLHQLKGLETGKKIFYRLCAVDERGHVVAGPLEEITPAKIPNAKYIPADMSGPPPYVLTSGYYVVTEDIEANTRAFTITGNGVTLDLNGHTVTYDLGEPLVQGAWNDYVYSPISTFGIVASSSTYKVINGTIQQDKISPSKGDIGIGFNPFYGNGQGEIAFIKTFHSGADVSAILARYGTVKIHNSQINDYGHVVTNRHQGIKAIHGAEGNYYNNYISRARHQGIMGGDQVLNNEVHVDSYATNSFGANLSGTTINRLLDSNRIYGTGYHVVAVGWKNKLQAVNNYIFMAGLQQFNRSSEYGNHCSLNGFRLTQYNGGTTPFLDMNYINNIVSIHVSSVVNQARPIQLMSNQYVSNIMVSGNTFRTHVVDLESSNITKVNKEIASIVLHGSTPDTSNPIIYRDNTLISNYRMIMAGDSYAGGGSNHVLINNKFVREGNSNKFSFGRFGWWTPPTFNNRFLDSKVIGDIALDQPVFDGSSSARQDYSVGAAYYLKVMDCAGNILNGSNFVFSDNRMDVISGAVNQEGIILIHVLDYTMSGSNSNVSGTKTLHSNPVLNVTNRTTFSIPTAWSSQNNGKTRATAIPVYLGQNGNQC